LYREIQAKTLLATVRGDDELFGLKYNLNLYRGCEHQCIYCDSRSECYGIENFNDVLVKINAIELLEKELPRKRVKGTVGFGSMSDPYTRAELKYGLTTQALQVLLRFGFPAHLITKSDLILKDIDVLADLARIHASVCFTITTTDDALARIIEPGAPPPSARLAAMQALAARGVAVGTTLMPVLPFLEDNQANIRAIVEQTAAHGGTFLVPWFGMSLRDRQRAYYYEKLDRHFPGLRAKYERRYGERYGCPCTQSADLERQFYAYCKQMGMETRVKRYQPAAPKQVPAAEQLALF
jgi:DNA repair photolyase